MWIMLVPLLQAAEPAFVRESIRARGMGNAFTAVANDEMLLFYNTAGLRSVTYNMYELVGFNMTTNVGLPKNPLSSYTSNASIDPDNINIEQGGIGSLTGKKIYAEGGLGFLSHVNSRFGWSLFSNGLLDIQVRNPVFPYLESKAYMQTGLAGGMAWSFLDYQLDVGLGAKLVQRAGIDTKLHVFDEAVIEVTEDKKTTKLQKKFSNKASFAPDAGAVYHFDSIHNLEPKVAVSLQNIGGLNFKGAGKVPMTLNIGASTESELSGFDFILAADYHDLADANKLVSQGSMITQRNLKMGFEVGWNKLNNGHHLISLRLGRNGTYNSMGMSFNLWKLKIDLAKYSQEIGGYAGELEDKRWSFQTSLIF